MTRPFSKNQTRLPSPLRATLIATRVNTTAVTIRKLLGVPLAMVSAASVVETAARVALRTRILVICINSLSGGPGLEPLTTKGDP